jgi:hypothetical protein
MVRGGGLSGGVDRSDRASNDGEIESKRAPRERAMDRKGRLAGRWWSLCMAKSLMAGIVLYFAQRLLLSMIRYRSRSLEIPNSRWKESTVAGIYFRIFEKDRRTQHAHGHINSYFYRDLEAQDR